MNSIETLLSIYFHLLCPMRFALSIFLISLMSTVIVPKDWLHDCHEHDVALNLDIKADASIEASDDCDICDFQIANYLPIYNDGDSIPLLFGSAGTSVNTLTIFDDATLLQDGRAPPRLLDVLS